MIKNVTGQVARGEDFFGREKEQRRFWERLDTDNLMLLAPRRLGKTSLLQRLRETGPEHGYRVVYLEVSDAANELVFAKRIYEALLEVQDSTGSIRARRLAPLVQSLKRVKKLSGWGVNIELADGQSPAWAEQAQVVGELLHGLDGRWLIQIDELPLFLVKKLLAEPEASRSRISEFLLWLRRMRQEQPDTRWVLAGSIGLDTVAARLRISDAINDLAIFPLKEFDFATAGRLLEHLAASYAIELPSESRDYAVSKIGWTIPYHLQILFAEIRELHEERRLPCSTDEVDQAIDRLLSPAHDSYFDFWRQRLRDELGRPDSDLALSLLNHICHDSVGVGREVLGRILIPHISEPTARDERLRYLLRVFENDGYLVQDGVGRWRFLSPLLREFWLRRVAP